MKAVKYGRALLAGIFCLAGATAGTYGDVLAQTFTNPPIIDPTVAEAARAGRGIGGLQSQVPSVAMTGPVDPMTYYVGPGDVLQLAFWGRVSRNEVLEVGPEGTVLVPGAGMLKVSGRTLSEARSLVLELVRREVRGVNLDVRLLKPRRFIVNVTGEVKTSGPVEVLATSRVSDVLPAAVLTDGAARRRVEILKRDGSHAIADLELFYRTGDIALNPYLNDGDIVQVPVATEFVFVAGAIARPGRYELGPRDSLRTLMRIAGDPLPSASEDRALLIRWRDPFQADSLWLSLGDVYSGRINPQLSDGERLYLFFVPQYHEQREAVISGEVSRPGSYPITEGQTRIVDLIHAAGGFLKAADLSAIRIKRTSPDVGDVDPEFDRMLRLSRNELTATEYEKLRPRLAGLRSEYRVDWARLEQNSESLDLLLRNGDEVRVERLVSSIRVDGEVRRPGILEYRPGDTIEDYIRNAGGFSNRAWSGKVRVTRSVTGQTLLAKDVQSLNPGDFVWVPEKPDFSIYQPFKEVITSLALISTIVIAIVSVSK